MFEFTFPYVKKKEKEPCPKAEKIAEKWKNGTSSRENYTCLKVLSYVLRFYKICNKLFSDGTNLPQI